MYTSNIFKKYGTKLSIWVQDLWPESVSSMGFIKQVFVVPDKLTGDLYIQIC